MTANRWWTVSAAIALAACGGAGTKGAGGGTGSDGGGGSGGTVPTQPSQPSPPAPPKAPVVSGDWTYYGQDQGLTRDVFDASADEGGNVYVAAGSAVFAKKRDDQDFARFDASNAGLTQNCHDPAQIANENPPDPAVMCPIVSVAGASAGKALLGYQGVGTDADYPQNADWAIDSGGADVVAFDGAKLTRTRWVHIAGWPHQMCDDHAIPDPNNPATWCLGDRTWTNGRRKVRQVLRIAIDHRQGAITYGDAWFAGTHGTFSLLVANPTGRGMMDLSSQFPGTSDRIGVWEHDHPAITDGVTGKFLTGESTAMAIDPLSGDPWAANEFRLAGKVGYGAGPRNWDAAMWPGYAGWNLPAQEFYDVWPDFVPATFSQYNAFDQAWMDATQSVSFCDDGALWVASGTLGLRRITFDRGAIAANPGVSAAQASSAQQVDLPAGTGNSAWAVACDPDGSVWVGLGWGGFVRRMRDGSWQDMPADAPALAKNPVRNIQIDRWSSPRRVYFAHVSSTAFGPGGLTVYKGP
jgi:hypothetical protein